METSKISSKGQIVIPKSIRKELNLTEGSLMMMEVLRGMVVIKKIDADLTRQFKRSLGELKTGRARNSRSFGRNKQ